MSDIVERIELGSVVSAESCVTIDILRGALFYIRTEIQFQSC